MQAEMTEIVMPSDANSLGTCFGGRIMSWIDIVAAIAANRAVGMVVTASVDSIEFNKPIKIGDVVTLQASVNRIWNSSLEVGVRVMVQRSKKMVGSYTTMGEQQQACKAYLTFVAVYDNGKRRNVSTTNEYELNKLGGKLESNRLRRYIEANERRKIRLANKRS